LQLSLRLYILSKRLAILRSLRLAILSERLTILLTIWL
jgi:hypothetical protein